MDLKNQDTQTLLYMLDDANYFYTPSLVKEIKREFSRRRRQERRKQKRLTEGKEWAE